MTTDQPGDPGPARDERRTDTTTVALPEDVIERIEARLPGTTFDSVDAYAAATLELVLRQVADQGQPDGESGAARGTRPGSTEGLATDDRDAVAEQLESLGYL